MPHVESNGIQVHYQERGSGDPVLMIMGITAPGEVWEAHADDWSQQFRCIMPDNRGVGLSRQARRRLLLRHDGRRPRRPARRPRHRKGPHRRRLHGLHHRPTARPPAPRQSPVARPHVPLGQMRPLRHLHLHPHGALQGTPHSRRVHGVGPTPHLYQAVLGQRRRPRLPARRPLRLQPANPQPLHGTPCPVRPPV